MDLKLKDHYKPERVISKSTIEKNIHGLAKIRRAIDTSGMIDLSSIEDISQVQFGTGSKVLQDIIDGSETLGNTVTADKNIPF
jgi:hypothetical protein